MNRILVGLPVPILSASLLISYDKNIFRTVRARLPTMLYKALLILSGNAAASLFLLARNLIVARMIPVSDYGVAATFALAMGVVEMASTLGLQQQIIQSKDGDDPRFQAALQGFQLFRGVLAGLALFAAAGPFARFLGIPEVAWAYQILAIVPVLNALQHFDIHRLSRHMRFGPLLMTSAVPAVAALALVWPLAIWLGDWQVMLWSIIVQASIGALTSHLMAERPYRLVWDKVVVSESLRYGWPLFVNAMLMYLVFHGDKVLVSRALGMEALAIFAMGMTLTLTPTLVLARTANNLFLPRVSQAVGTPDFVVRSQQALQSVSFTTLLFVLFILLVGAPLVQLLLGTKYAGLTPLLIWLALLQALRVMKTGPAIVALAMGQTSNPMIANLVRVTAFPLAWFVLENDGDLLDLLLVGLIAEGLGFCVSIALMISCTRLPAPAILVQQGGIMLMMIVVSVLAWHFPPSVSVASWPIWLASGVLVFIALVLLPELTRRFRGKFTL